MVSHMPPVRATSEPWSVGTAAGVDGADTDIDTADNVYTVKGQTYLVGKAHEDKICRGMKCELFVEVGDVYRILMHRSCNYLLHVLWTSSPWTTGYPAT